MKSTDDYTQQAADDTLKNFDVDPSRGRAENEIAKLAEEFGYNEILEQEETLLHRIFRRFWGPIPWMIELAAILSAAVQKWEDFIIIMVMLLVNAFLDFFQEHRALNALEALKKRLAKEVSVRRDGTFKKIPVRELVPGDIIKMKIGDIVPADVQLFEGDYLLVDQSALTGESIPVNKEKNDVAYANTIVKQGEMLAVVVNTGMNTQFSKVVSLVARAQLEERSHFQKMVIQIGNFLILITLVLVLIIIMVALFRHEPFLEIIRFTLVLTVAAIPVALPAVLSVTMAVGAMNLARREAIVSHLTAIEELAGVDIFCSDKTGTLTQNEMKVSDPVMLGDHTEEELFTLAALASRQEDNDPIERPIFQYIKEHFPDVNLQKYTQKKFIPFDPTRKRTEAVIGGNGEQFTTIKGATQVLMDLADMTGEEAINLNKTVDELASKGYRTIAVSSKKNSSKPEIIGLIPLYDPPRDDSKEVIDEMKNYGVQIKMLTGDNLAIAKEIGRILGLEQRTIRSSQLSGAASNEILTLVEVLTTAVFKKLKGEISMKEAKEFASQVMKDVKSMYDTRLLEREFIHTRESAIVEMIEEVDIFAEVIPEDKYRIVDTLQKGNHIVAMTGDGVNDAPALKKADCGFAVSNATDAARSAADIILTTPGLGVIKDAMEQARITFGRMKSYATFRIAETIRLILFMTLSILVFNFYPITALMIILLALFNDIPILAIAYDNTRIHQSPVRWNMQELLTISSVLGIAGVISSFILFFLLKESGFTNEMIQSIFFLKLIVAGHSTIYVTRSEGWFWQKPLPSPLLFWATTSTEILSTIIAVYGLLITPIGWLYALGVWIYALAWFVFNDAVKMWAYKLLGNHKEDIGAVAKGNN
jgi:H+-transporting ATPase